MTTSSVQSMSGHYRRASTNRRARITPHGGAGCAGPRKTARDGQQESENHADQDDRVVDPGRRRGGDLKVRARRGGRNGSGRRCDRRRRGGMVGAHGEGRSRQRNPDQCGPGRDLDAPRRREAIRWGAALVPELASPVDGQACLVVDGRFRRGGCAAIRPSSRSTAWGRAVRRPARRPGRRARGRRR